MSLNNLKNNETNSPTERVPSLGLTPVRVFSIILDNTHPKYTGEDSIGTIFYGKVDSNELSLNLESLNRARPLFSFIKQYPLQNEIVLILNTTSRNIYGSIGGDNAFVSTYYLPNINIWNNSHHNALPIESTLRSSANSQESSIGIQQNNVESNEIKLGEYFKENPNIKNIQPFEGDTIIEGRFGNSIRFGSSNPRGKNNWSDNESEGDPITIISNGQPQVNGDTILEDINNIGSSIFMLSNQNINNFTPSSTNLQSLGVSIAPTPTQVLIEDTPDPPIEPSFIPIIEEPTESIIEETPIIESPPLVDDIISPIEDPIFALLDEAQDEGELRYTTSVYSFSEFEPEFGAAARPDEYIIEEETPIVTDLDNTDVLPEYLIPKKVKYKPVYINPNRKWTSIPKSRLASVINSFNIPNSLKYSIMFVAIKEQGKGDQVGGYNNNHYGIMADIGRWRYGSLINGAIPATEGVGGQGVRTDKVRYFASFPTAQVGVDFMAKTLNGKGFSEATQNNIVDLYIDRWLSPSKATADRVKRDKRTTYSNLFLTAKNLIDNVV